MSYIISNIITNSSYLSANGTISLNGSGVISGSYTMTGFNCNCLRQGDIKNYYTSTGETYVHNSVSYEVYQSKYGLAFIWLYSKNNLKYRKYLK